MFRPRSSSYLDFDTQMEFKLIFVFILNILIVSTFVVEPQQAIESNYVAKEEHTRQKRQTLNDLLGIGIGVASSLGIISTTTTTTTQAAFPINIFYKMFPPPSTTASPIGGLISIPSLPFPLNYFFPNGLSG